MNISHEIKLTYLAFLTKIAFADGVFNEWEDKYINAIATKLGISNEEKYSIQADPSQKMVHLPETLAQRIEFFYNLLFLMGIDNDITVEEKEMCKKIGFNLCFNPLLMDDLIEIMVENLGKDVPVDQVIQAIIKYQN